MSQPEMMARAIQLAERGKYTTSPNPNVGCVIVKEGQIIAEGWHQKAGQGHAEVNALAQLAEGEAGDADCYVTLEPCSHTGKTPPCAEALIKAGIKRAFVAMIDPNPLVAGNGIAKLEQAGIDVEVGLLQQQAEALNLGFIQRMKTGRPRVVSKIAMSLDGRTAMSSGESQWITSEAARLDVQKLRAQAGAIMTGVGTVEADDPKMTVRTVSAYPTQEIRQPLRVVVDSQLRIQSQAAILNTNDAETVVATLSDKKRPQITTWQLPEQAGHVDLTALMNKLAEHQVNDVLVEAGSVLNGVLLTAGLVDEVIIYMAPKLMGDGGRGLFHLPALTTMSENIDFDITDIRAVGKDWRITATPVQ